MKTSKTLSDDDTDESSVQRVVPAGAATRPNTNAPNSVFDAARKAKREALGPRLGIEEIVIRKGVPKPAKRGEAGSMYLDIIRKMEPTDSVELPLSQAKSLYARAKEYGKNAAPPQRFSIRTLSKTMGAVWRDS